MNSVRHIYNDDFYKITAVLLSEKYFVLKNTLRKEYNEANLLIPEKGFSNEVEYREWLKKAMSLPKKPGKYIEDILFAFNLDVKDEFYRNCVASEIFFYRMTWEDSIYPQSNITLTTRNSGKKRGLWVEIKPWTKKEDYVELWETISKIQKSLIGYRSKEKFQKTFARDFAVYQLYTETRQSFMPLKKISFDKVMHKMAESSKYHSLSNKFKGENMYDQTRQIINRFNYLLKDIKIF